MDNLEKLIRAGKIAYGDNWQSPASRALGISDRTIRNFVSGKSPAPVDLSERLRTAIENEVIRLQSEVEARIAKCREAIAFIDSDRVNGDRVTEDVISSVVDKFEYRDEQDKKAAIDAVNNAIYETTWMSDLEQVAKKWSAE